MKSNKQKKQKIKEKRQKQAQKAASGKTPYNYIPKYLTEFQEGNNIPSDITHLPEVLQQTIKHAYTIFNYPVPESYDICTFCCVTPAEAEALKTIPRQLMPTELIYSYNDTAKNELQNKEEVAYLLPRMLELIALDQDIHHSTELYLDRVGRVDPKLWLPAEKQILEQFTIQYLIYTLEQSAHKQEIVFLNEILVMYGIGGIDIKPVLEEIKQLKSWYSIVSIAYLLMSERKADGTINNPFADEYPQINISITRWFKTNKEQLKKSAQHAISQGGHINTQLYGARLHFLIEQSLVDLSSVI